METYKGMDFIRANKKLICNLRTMFDKVLTLSYASKHFLPRKKYEIDKQNEKIKSKLQKQIDIEPSA